MLRRLYEPVGKKGPISPVPLGIVLLWTRRQGQSGGLAVLGTMRGGSHLAKCHLNVGSVANVVFNRENKGGKLVSFPSWLLWPLPGVSLLFQAGFCSELHLEWAEMDLLEMRMDRDCFPWTWSESGSLDGRLKPGLVCGS